MLQLIARGYLYKEIAARLQISVKTVETHVSSVLRKLQLSTRHELTRWATEHRLVWHLTALVVNHHKPARGPAYAVAFVTARTLARWTSLKAPRCARRRAVVVAPRRQLPQVLGRDEQLADLVGLGAEAVQALVARVDRQPDDAVRVRGVAQPEHRGGHRQVLVDPQEGDQGAGLRRPLRRAAARVEPVSDPRGGVVQEGAHLVVVEAARPCRPHRQQQRVRLPAVGVVARVDDLLGGTRR